MKRITILLLCYLLLSLFVPSVAEDVSITGKVIEIEKYGHAVL